MKVLLLEHPRYIARERCNDIANTPLSSSLISGYVAGMLSDRGHEVKIIEGYLEKMSYDEIFDEVRDFSPDLMAVHLVYSWGNNQNLFALINKLKSDGSAKFVLVYGFYPTFAYEEILRSCPALDGAVISEPELTLAELTERFDGTGVPKSISGMAWRNEDGSLEVKRRDPVENLDDLPYPLRTPVMMKMYEVNLEGSRGCYGGCTFCYINPYYGREHACWRGRTPEHIMSEIDQIIAKWGKKEFYFTDPNFFGPGKRGQERALKLAQMIKERKIHFGIEARVNDIHEETISALVEAGLRDILIGLESGKDDSLKRLNKMTTVAQNERALKILRKYGIEPNVGFIMFEPDSSLADIRTNFEFLLRNDLLKNLAITANVLYHPQIILQGTKAYQGLKKAGTLVLGATTYEGAADFADPQVKTLADAMSRITNHLFVRMNDIWSGRVPEPEDAEGRYQKLNQLLVQSFSHGLEQLESGVVFSNEEISQIVAFQKQKMNEYLPL